MLTPCSAACTASARWLISHRGGPALKEPVRFVGRRAWNADARVGVWCRIGSDSTIPRDRALRNPAAPNGETVSADDVSSRDVPRRSFVRVLGVIAGGTGIGVSACNVPLFRDSDTPNDRDHEIRDQPYQGGDIIFQDEDSRTNDSRHGDGG